jgi:hypothetical protein
MLDVSANFKDAVYAPIRKVDAKIDFTLNGVTNTYKDSIVSINLLEEMSTINNSLPANELKVTLDNTQGDFDMLNMRNMQDIIASRPQIDVSFGVQTLTMRWSNITELKWGDL